MIEHHILKPQNNNIFFRIFVMDKQGRNLKSLYVSQMILIGTYTHYSVPRKDIL